MYLVCDFRRLNIPSLLAVMPVGSDARLGSFGCGFQACGTCVEIASRLRRIFSHPTDQGAALQTNHPPSISLPDWQPGVWLQTKSVNNRVSEMHISHVRNSLCVHTASDLCFTCQSLDVQPFYAACMCPDLICCIRRRVEMERKGNALLRFKLTEILSAFQL